MAHGKLLRKMGSNRAAMGDNENALRRIINEFKLIKICSHICMCLR